MNLKKIVKLVRETPGHWVGDGFPVRTLFSYREQEAEVSPFLLLDYAGPAQFPPGEKQRGVEQHPHRGFETVTIVFQGEVEHHDTAGNKGKIGPGDVQWMTAARGVLHEEYHGREFTRKGGTLEMVQLWVNLPAKDKMSPPGYQEILGKNIPQVPLPEQAGTVRVIAGDYAGTPGAAKTFSPVHLWDIRLTAGGKTELQIPDGFSAAILVRRGQVRIHSKETVLEGELAHFDLKGSVILLQADNAAEILLMSGKPLGEPVAGYGPFVMNTRQEIQQALEDFNSNRF